MLAEGRFGLLPITEVLPARINDFSCGQARLDDYLRTSALSMHGGRLGLTTAVFHEDCLNKIVAYFTLANDAIPLHTSEQFSMGLGEVELSAFPAVKLCRLGVSRELQGQGVGHQVMDLIFGEILDSRSLAAARLVVVDADNDPAVRRFYESLSFEVSLWAEKSRHAGKRGGQPASIKMHRDILRTLHG